jgi:membrane protein DedA with SNARE-associated domain
MFYSALQPIILEYGLIAVFVIVMLESAGLPLPGETALILASVYAGLTGDLEIAAIIAVAATAAIIGDNIGFAVGRRFGLPLVKRFGPMVGLDDKRLRFGQHMFARHGAKIVFFGRFIAFLRIFAAVLAGVNRYSWRSFLMFNAAGGIIWATLFGIGGFIFGDAMHRIAGPVGFFGLGLAVIGIFIGWKIMRDQEEKFEARMTAEAAAVPAPSPLERNRVIP